MPGKLVAGYLRRLANWLDPPNALTVRITCDPTRAIASLEQLQAAYRDMLDKLEWRVNVDNAPSNRL